MIEALKLGEIETSQGLNQEMGLARPGVDHVSFNMLYLVLVHVIFCTHCFYFNIWWHVIHVEGLTTKL